MGRGANLPASQLLPRLPEGGEGAGRGLEAEPMSAIEVFWEGGGVEGGGVGGRGFGGSGTQAALAGHSDEGTDWIKKKKKRCRNECEVKAALSRVWSHGADATQQPRLHGRTSCLRPAFVSSHSGPPLCLKPNPPQTPPASLVCSAAGSLALLPLLQWWSRDTGERQHRQHSSGRKEGAGKGGVVTKTHSCIQF